MFAVETIITFVTASLVLALVPGPDNIFVLTQSSTHGARSGVLVTLGLCSGLVIHTMAVVLGVAVVFQASSIAFLSLKYAGALYLVILAWKAFIAARERIELQATSYRAIQLYGRGFIMNIVNPKVSIFFLAFLPQFTDSARGSISFQILVLGLIFIICAFIIFSIIAILAGVIGKILQRSKGVQKAINVSAGVIYILLSLRLVFQT